MESKKFNIFDGFILKVIALVTMTFDHIGIFITNPQIANIFRTIGRLAFPLFIFLLVEGVRHTHHFGKYFLRIAILALIIMIGTVGVTIFIDSSFTFSSPILDLVFVSLMIYLINRKDKLSFLAILPAAFLVLCFAIEIYEDKNASSVKFLPYFLRADYTIFGLLLSLGFYFSKPLVNVFLKTRDETKDLTETNVARIGENLLSILSLMIATFLYQLISKNYEVCWEILLEDFLVLKNLYRCFCKTSIRESKINPNIANGITSYNVLDGVAIDIGHHSRCVILPGGEQ